jgi:hypothetical protein
VNGLEQPDPHHLSEAARVIPVGLVHRLRPQHLRHMARLDANHRQLGFGQRRIYVLRERSGFQPDPLEVCRQGRSAATRSSASLGTFSSRMISPEASTTQMLVRFRETSSPAK